MMTERAQSGQLIEQSPFAKASVQNDGLDAIADFKRRQLGGRIELIRGKKLTDLVSVRNMTGGDLAHGKVLQLGDLELDELDNDQLWFAADVLADPADQKYCILRAPIPDGEIGDAQVSGCCIASVNVSNVVHCFADPVSGETDFASSASGLLEILSPITSTGVQDCVVRFGTPRLMGFYQGILLADFERTDSTVTCDHVHAIDGGPSCLEDPTDEDEVATLYNTTGFSGTTGNIVYFRYNHYTHQLEIVDTDCYTEDP